jgi:peroxiredoxin
MKYLLPLVAVLLLNSCVGAPNPKKIAEANEVHLKQEGIERLRQGDLAPAFTASTADGQRVTIGVEPEVEEPAGADVTLAAAPDSATVPEERKVPPAVTAEQADSNDGSESSESPAADPASAEATAEEELTGEAGKPIDESVDSEPSSGPYTVLFFYPANFTPNSTKHLRELSKAREALAAVDVQVYGISLGSAEQLSRFARENGITIPLLVDTGAVAQLYGALAEGGKHPQRTLVGIRPDGTIGFYDRAFSHLPLDKVVLQKTGRKAPAETAK